MFQVFWFCFFTGGGNGTYKHIGIPVVDTAIINIADKAAARTCGRFIADFLDDLDLGRGGAKTEEKYGKRHDEIASLELTTRWFVVQEPDERTSLDLSLEGTSHLSRVCP